MIQPLRKSHRRIFVVLALVIPAIVVAGVAGRHARPKRTGGVLMAVSSRSSNNLILASRSGSVIIVISRKPMEFPDLLAYWSESPNAQLIDDHARFLGRFVPGQVNRYAVPASGDGGTLILYSATFNKVVDRTEVGGAR